ncbi:MAG: TetR/AcrR family transcriptional regulator [Myxococcales bacterium]
MARPRFEKLSVEKREAILQAAANEIVAHGCEAASVNRILESVGLSKGAFYYYFDDKADFGATVCLWAMDDLFKLFDELKPAADPDEFWKAMQDSMRRGLQLMSRSPHSNELMMRIGHAMVRDKALSERLTASVTRATDALIAMLRHGQEIGAVRSDLPLPVLVVLLQGIKEALIRSYVPQDHTPSPEELERIGALQLDLYRRVAAPAAEENR